ncbi:DUF2510 domain-containing protein [Mycobacterium sp. E2733]|uniref:DUF2510 domain-containing protein n=1 Tax=Mycobacterium sp. E2733 TaxID=1834138 RepID=UPI0008016063|nr:DUF2510 domain-containing protein [Mycobacterium sp. E2733]OBH91279.1 hypothetical protein A5678_11290 [Mycobacterium sp. E2733]
MNAGWFPDPSGQPGQRYFDGQRWTQHFVPTPPPFPQPPAPAVAVAVSTGSGTNHALHAVLTLLTCGLWLPIWILAAIFGGSSKSSVAVGGAGGAIASTRSNHRTLLIGAGVFLGLVMLGIITEHPWLLIVLVPIVGAGGFFFWKQKSARDRRDQELREEYRRDVLSNRAEYEDRLYCKGDPRGTYGRYMPPPPFDQAEST